MESYQIKIFKNSREEGNATVEILDEELCKLKFRFQDVTIIETAEDYFETLKKIRIKLSEIDLSLYCYGSGLNVCPSQMSRQMGGGIKAYKLKLGEKAKIKDLVNIFESGPDITISSVRDQEEFYDKWTASTNTFQKKVSFLTKLTSFFKS